MSLLLNEPSLLLTLHLITATSLAILSLLASTLVVRAVVVSETERRDLRECEYV